MHNFLPSTYLVWNMIACGSATGLQTFSAVMPGNMTQSTCLLGLTLYQICVLPLPSRFSILIPHFIHLFLILDFIGRPLARNNAGLGNHFGPIGSLHNDYDLGIANAC